MEERSVDENSLALGLQFGNIFCKKPTSNLYFSL